MSTPEATPTPVFAPTEVSLEDMEALDTANSQTAEQPGTDLNATILQGDTVPEAFRGMSAAQLAERATRLEQALAISERARTTPASPAPVAPAAPAQPAVPSITAEQLQEMYERNPLEAMATMVQIAETRALANVEQRLGHLTGGVASAAEAQARTRYAEDFELFGDEIKAHAARVDPRALSTQEGWDSLVSFVRGKNVDKVIEKRLEAFRKEMGAPTRADAQASQVSSAMPTLASRRAATAASASDTHGLDATALEVCKVLGISPADYKKYA